MCLLADRSELEICTCRWPSCAVQDLQDVGCVGRVKYGVLLYGKVRQAKPTTRADAELSYAMFMLYWFATAEAMCTMIRLLTSIFTLICCAGVSSLPRPHPGGKQGSGVALRCYVVTASASAAYRLSQAPPELYVMHVPSGVLINNLTLSALVAGDCVRS